MQTHNGERMKSFQPLYSRILVLPFDDPKEEKLESGIIIPDSARDERIGRGRVLEVGHGRPIEGSEEVALLKVEEGDKIMYVKNRAFAFRMQTMDLILMDEADILGIYKDEDESD
jgi:co-chaperonin GroES (HSP10)